MSSLLLVNPFAPPQGAPQEPGDSQQNQEAVQPASGADGSSGAGSATSNPGGSSGQGNSGTGTSAAFTADRAKASSDTADGPPPDATAKSVVQARTSDISAEIAARNFALETQQNLRADALVESISADREVAPVVQDLAPPPDLPDPLPTSPILRRMSEDG